MNSSWPIHFCLWFALAVAGCGRTSGEPEPVVIGQLVSQNGSGGGSETSVRHGAELAIAVANAGEHPIDNRGWVLVQSAVGDKPEEAQRTAVRLITLNHAVALIVDTDPASAEVLCRVGTQYRVPVVTTRWLPGRVLRPFAFTVAPTPTARGKALAAAVPPSARVVVLVNGKSEGSPALADAFTAALPNGTTAERTTFTDLDSLKKAAAHVDNVQSVLLAGSTADLAPLRTELANAKLPPAVPILFGSDEEPPEALIDAAGAAHPIVWTTVFAPADGSTGKEFGESFARRYQTAPDEAAALANDAARVLFEAMRQARSADGTKIRDRLATLKDVPGTTGPLSFGSESGVERPVLVVQRSGGKTVLWASKPR